MKIKDFARKRIKITKDLTQEFKDFKDSPREESKRLFKKAIAKLRKEEETEIDKDSSLYQIEVIMYDGSISKYPKGFIITDRINSVECEGKLYHTSLYCPKLRAESNDYTLPIKALKILKAHERNINYCFYCEQKLYEELDYERDYMNEYGEEDEE